MNYDGQVRESFKKSPNTTFSWFLASSYAYYCRYESLLSDETFDKMCAYMLENYDKLEHQHKHLVTKEMLTAGSGYNLTTDDYPTIVKVTAEKFIQDLNIMRNKQ